MPCKINIKAELDAKINNLVAPAYNKNIYTARSIVKSVNAKYGAPVARIVQRTQDQFDIAVNIPTALIDKYFDAQKELEINEARNIQQEDAERAGEEYDDRYMFQISPEVNYVMKAVDILSSDRAKQVFEKGQKNNWSLDKILTELQIPKEQKQIILDKNLGNKIAGKKLSIIAERRKLATKWDLENSQLIKDIRADKTQPKELKPNAADNNLAAIMLYGMKMSELQDKGLLEEMSEATTLAYRILNDFMFDIDELISFKQEILDVPEYAQALTTNENPVKEFFENDIFKESDKIEVDLREEIITSLLADNSFAVEINTATKPNKMVGMMTEFYLDGTNYEFVDGVRGMVYYKSNRSEGFFEQEISKKEFEQAYNTLQNRESVEPTQHYSNLTVPGGTNGSYIEANIETPLIIPSIKGHSQFSTDTSIGWYRMDEKQQYQEKDIENLIEIMKKSGILEVNCN